jgi:hypothetical protein
VEIFYFPASDVEAFAGYWTRTFQLADLVIVN